MDILINFIPSTTVPPWFAEGTAQHTYNDIFFDYWDSIRDMILRDKVSVSYTHLTLPTKA